MHDGLPAFVGWYNAAALRRLPIVFLFAALVALVPRSGDAQDEPPPPIGPFVFDLHGIMPSFPDSQQLADSRNMLLSELPGRGMGIYAAAHVYPFKWKAVTFGIGADLTLIRARSSAPVLSGVVVGRPVTEQFAHASPQISFNFGKGTGWSYISGGYGPGQWSVVADSDNPTDLDTLIQPIANYGGGARWFIKRHLAFSFDVRMYAIVPKTSLPGYPRPPRTTLFSIGAGISVK
jgi:hypothetical protein